MSFISHSFEICNKISPLKKEKLNVNLPKQIRHPPILFQETQKLIQKLENSLDAPLIVYWNSFSGSVCSNDVNALEFALEKLGKVKKLYVFIKSNGGSGEAALRLVHLLRQYAHEVIALIPLECASAGTMLVLGANEIKMGPISYLTAVDTSIRHELSPINQNNYLVSVSLNELSRITKLWDDESKINQSQGNPYHALYPFIHPLVIGAVDRASSLSIRICNEILSYHMKDTQLANKIANSLNNDYPSHSYPITFPEAQRIGLNVSKMDEGMNSLLINLNFIYAEMTQQLITDFSDTHYYENQIKNILEIKGTQIFFQAEREFYYRSQEKRWITMNDVSAWKKVEALDGKIQASKVHFG